MKELEISFNPRLSQNITIYQIIEKLENNYALENCSITYSWIYHSWKACSLTNANAMKKMVKSSKKKSGGFFIYPMFCSKERMRNNINWFSLQRIAYDRKKSEGTDFSCCHQIRIFCYEWVREWEREREREHNQSKFSL